MSDHCSIHDEPKDPLAPCSGPIDIVYGTDSPVRLSDVSRRISSAKKRSRSIEHLGFLGCKFRDGTSDVFRALGRKLRKVRCDVRELAIHGVTGVGNEELAYLAPFLNGNATLQSLELTRATFDAGGIEEVRPFFRRNSSLERLVLGENECVGDEGVEAIVSELQRRSYRRRRRRRGSKSSSGGLRVLAVESCGVTPKGACSISMFMNTAAGGSLRFLELSNNNIGDAGAERLAGAIDESGHRLGHLGLNDAGIGDRGALRFAELLETNRSLHTLSLQNNKGITDVGASALLKSVYDTDSARNIIEKSNHVLRDLNLRGCARVGPGLLRVANRLCARGRMLGKGEADIVRWKVSEHVASSERGMALEDFDLELMPHILAFVGKASGMTSLFHTLKSMPLLYTQYDAEHRFPAKEEKNLDEEEEKGGREEERPSGASDNAAFLEQLRMSSRRARKYYAVFANLVPSRSSMLRYQDRRFVRSKHESSSVSTSNNSLSSTKTTTSTGGNTAFVQLGLYFTVLRRALLLWLFCTRRIANYCVLVLSKLFPRVRPLLFVICQPFCRGI